MPERTNYLSREGLEKLEAELHELKSVRVRETSARIESAKALGDLKENAEYHSAKDEMAFLQGRIREIEEMLKNYAIFEDVSGGSTVKIGATVEVESRGKARVYKIVGSEEADPVKGLISNESPLGRAFLNRAVNDQIEVETPSGILTYTIIKIS